MIGENKNEILQFNTADDKSLDKWTNAFKQFLKRALKDEVDLEVIVIRSKIVEQKPRPTNYIT